MPPRTRKPAEKPADTAEAPARPAKTDGDICRQCWPKGWSATAKHASCVHGNYKR